MCTQDAGSLDCLLLGQLAALVGPKVPSFYSGLLLQADAQPYHLSPSGVQQVNERGSFVFSCTVETGMTPPFDVFLNGSLLTERLSGVLIPMGARYTFGPLTTSDSGSVLRCASGNVFAVESATLDVTCECHPCMGSLHTVQTT